MALPVVVDRDRHLDFRAWVPGDRLEPGDHGTWHPAATAPLVVPQVVLVPLLAFDRRGFRLGYGGGYYDRTLESLRRSAYLTTIGVGFSAQEVAAVPHDALDQRLDWLATETGLIKVDAE
jgi:5-formyltetrahydrofolate cyclo-ligase